MLDTDTREGFYIEPRGNDNYKSFNSEKFEARAFDVNANIYLYGCGQGLTGSALHKLYPQSTEPNLIDNMQRLTKETIVGYSVTLEWGKSLGSFVPYSLGLSVCRGQRKLNKALYS